LTLEPDPRVQLPAGALQDQLRLASKLADLLSAASRALLTATSEQEQLKALAPTGSAAEAVRSYTARLSALLSSPEKKADQDKDAAVTEAILPDVQSHLDTLYAEVITC
jgi:hypothetical protein